jgi:hypothetical protein
MFGTRAAKLRIAGAAAAVLATGFTLYGVTGAARADTTYGNAFCYKNPPGSENPDRLLVSNVVATGPAADGTYALTWRAETQYWAEAFNTYANATGAYRNNTLAVTSRSALDHLMSSASNICQYSGSGYSYGVWG